MLLLLMKELLLFDERRKSVHTFTRSRWKYKERSMCVKNKQSQMNQTCLTELLRALNQIETSPVENIKELSSTDDGQYK
jgi:hypothetical protein